MRSRKNTNCVSCFTFNNRFIGCDNRDFTVKKRIRLLFLFILLICLFIVNSITTKNSINTLAKDKQLYFASNSSEQELEENIDDQLGDIDFSGLDEILKNLSDSEKSIFKGKGFVEIVILKIWERTIYGQVAGLP